MSHPQTEPSQHSKRLPWWRVRLLPLTIVFVVGVSAALLVLARVDPYVGRVVTEWVLAREQRQGVGATLLKGIFGVELEASARELFRSIRESDLTDLDVLLNAKVSPDSLDEQGRSAMRVAVEMSSQSAVMMLVSRGADINLADRTGVTPLIAAVQANSVDSVIHLLRLRVDVNRAGPDGDTPLLVAVSEQNTPLVDILLGQQANVNIANSEGKTPLMVAIERDNPSLVSRLLNEKANVNMRDSAGDNALIYSVRSENVQLIAALLSTDINLEARNAKGETAADIAAQRGGKVALLFSKSMSPDAPQRVVAEVFDAPAAPTPAPRNGEAEVVEEPLAPSVEAARATPTPAKLQMTRLRIIGNVEGTWERRKTLTLTAIRMVVRNVGDYKASGVMITVRVPGGDIVSMTGPAELERNATAEYTASAYKVVRQMGDLKADIVCANCYR